MCFVIISNNWLITVADWSCSVMESVNWAGIPAESKDIRGQDAWNGELTAKRRAWFSLRAVSPHQRRVERRQTCDTFQSKSPGSRLTENALECAMGEHWCKELALMGKDVFVLTFWSREHCTGKKERKVKERRKRLWQEEVVKVKQKDGRIAVAVFLPLLLESVCSVNWKCVFYCYSSLWRWRVSGWVGGVFCQEWDEMDFWCPFCSRAWAWHSASF